MHKASFAAAALAAALSGAPAGAAVFSYTGPGAAITDFTNNVSTITVADDFVVRDVDVVFQGLTHSLPREVQLYLERDGLSVALILNKDVGRNTFGDNFTFDDEGTAPISSWTGGTGVFRPAQPLSLFDGTSSAGLWRIRTYDNGAGDGGSFAGWTLRLSDGAAAAVPEPATWAMMIGGFGLVGGAMRRRGTVSVVTA